MVRRNYDALVSGDGACAGCGEKSVLRSITSVTEAYMRPLYHAKADRLRAKAGELEKAGVQKLAELKARNQEEYDLLRQAIAHLVMGLGGEDEKDTKARIAAHGQISDGDLVDAIVAVMLQEAFNHMNLQAIDGRLANGMSVMAMAAHTGCNTVYGSTPSNNPHPYPWMNSLFQDGITVGWLHRRELHHRSCPPVRHSRTAGRCADAADGKRHHPARVLRIHAFHRCADDRSGDSGTSESMGRRRRWRHGRHRVSEHFESDSPEPAERQSPDARYAGLFQHGRPELGFDARCSAETT